MTLEAMNTDRDGSPERSLSKGEVRGRSPSGSQSPTGAGGPEDFAPPLDTWQTGPPQENASVASAAGDAFEKAPAAAGEGSGQPPSELAPPGIEVKKEAKEESGDANRDPDGSTAARDGVTNLTPPNGSTDDAGMKLLADELEQTKQTILKLQSEKNKAETDARLALARAAAAENVNRVLMQQKVDLSPEPDSFGSPMKEDENMNAEWTQANLDHTRHNSGGWPRGSDTEVDDMCGWCTSRWKDGI